MTTVLDSLVLEFSLDPTKFTRGQQQAMAALRQMEEGARRQGTEVESQSKKILDLLGTVRREALGALAIYFGGRGAKEVFDYLVNLDATTGRFSRTVAMNTREVSAWQGAFEQIGGTAQSADAALGGLSGEMARFQLTGQSTILPVLSRLGISLYDQNHQLKTAAELWLELADAVKGMDPRQAVAFLQMIPGANRDMINFALLGRHAMEQYIHQAREAGVTTQESARAAQEYQKQLALLDRTATQTGRSLLTTFSGPLIWMLKGITALAQFVGVMTKPSAPGAQVDALGNVVGTEVDAYGRPLHPNFVEKFGSPTAEGSPEMSAARRALAAGMQSAESGGLAPNWQNFLSGLSFLETNQTNSGNATSSAQGYFQFLSGTASRAMAQGLPDPRSGSYAQQATATAAYIRRFHPNAAAAIDRGDYAAAIAELRGEWPSLPGGSQPQSAARYATFADELRGGGPRPSNVTTINVGGVNVYTQASDGAGIARDVDKSLQRSLTAGAANYGPQ